MKADQIKELIGKERARLAELRAVTRSLTTSDDELEDAMEEVYAIECNISEEERALATLATKYTKPCQNQIRYITADRNFIIFYRDRPRVYRCSDRWYAKIIERAVDGGGRLIPVRAVCADNGGCVCW